jgi:murein DD-endopeptidase MepM/ murein hydrolase activator NlpD
MDSRPWRLLVVPPTPDAPTRAFNVKRWQAKLAAWAIGILLIIAVADVVAVVITIREQQPAPTDAEVETLRHGLIALEDSIALARTSLAEAEAIARDSVAGLGIAANRARIAQLTARRRLLLAKGEQSSLAAASAGLPDDGSSAIEGLPVIGAIASGFSYARKHPLLPLVRPHLGVDVAARYGARITAPAAGRVSFVGRRFAFGLVVEMEHDGGITTRYAHCSAVLVRVGQSVPKGALIATVGSSGLTTGPHLHYEILRDGRQMDPTHFHFPRADTTAKP